MQMQVARKQGWRPQATASGQKPSSNTFAPTVSGSATQPQPLHVAQYSPPLSPDQSAQPSSDGPPATAVAHSGSDALHSAEAAAARASQIAEAAVTAGAAAEEAAADAEDYETASKHAQELLGSLGKPKSAAATGKRFYGKHADTTQNAVHHVRLESVVRPLSEGFWALTCQHDTQYASMTIVCAHGDMVGRQLVSLPG